jgi:opacity protein-like surface antigen
MGAYGIQVTKATGSSFFTTKFGSTSLDINGTDGHVSAVSLMANAWYEFDLGNSSPVRPFIGGGIGIAWVDVHDILEVHFPTKSGTSFYSQGLHGDDSGFAWQLGAGLAWEVSPGKDLTLEYRYFNGPEVKNIRFHDYENQLDYDYDAHSVMVGFKVGF